MKKNTKTTFSKSFSILAAAALSMTLIGGQAFPTYAGNTSGIETGAVIPDNITIDSPTALANVALPSNSYGTLSWVDGSYVPEKRVQSCAVVFKPSTGADLSGLPGWDSGSGTITGYVTVVVSSIDSSEGTYDNESSSEASDDSSENGTYSSDENTDSTDENGTAEDGQTTADKNNEKSDPEVTEAPSDESTTDEDTTDAADKENKDNTNAENGDQKEEETEAPSVTEAPETTAAPADSEASDDSKKDTDSDENPEITEAPGVTAAPSEGDGKAENKNDTTDKENKDPEVTETPKVTEIPEDNNNIFDRKDEEEDKRPQNAATDLTDTEKEQIAAQNHTCDGITVSGIDLPWYVQFRVSGGDDYKFTNEEDATIFKSYEFELWDTQKNTEYKIPDGEYISVTVPVKAGYTYSIEHILDNGAMETIIPSVDGDTMTFSTHSFSPFGIAGSKSLVGPDAGTDSSTSVTPAADADSADTSQSASTADTDASESADADLDTSTDLSTGSADLEASSAQDSSSSDEEPEDTSSQTTSKKQVNTGDTTQILPFVILFAAAAVVAGVAVFLKRRKK